MKPVQNFVEKYATFYDKMDDDAYLENYFAMERWMNDNIPVAGETFREFVKFLYQQNQLVRGEFRLCDKPVNLQKHLLSVAHARGGTRPPGARQFDAGDSRARVLEIYPEYVDRRRAHRLGG